MALAFQGMKKREKKMKAGFLAAIRGQGGLEFPSFSESWNERRWKGEAFKTIKPVKLQERKKKESPL